MQKRTVLALSASARLAIEMTGFRWHDDKSEEDSSEVEEREGSDGLWVIWYLGGAGMRVAITT